MAIEDDLKIEVDSKEELDAIDALAKEEKEFNKVRRLSCPAF